MPREEIEVLALTGFHVRTNKQWPSLAMLQFHTEDGTAHFLAGRLQLEQMSAAFARVAATLPQNTDLQ